MRKKILSLLVAATMTMVTLAGCGSNTATNAGTSSTESNKKEETTQKKESDDANKVIGVAMPTKDLQRWNQDGTNMEEKLKKAGYSVDLQFASNDIATQVSQVETMISNGCDLLVIASIDGDSLGTVLAQAKEKKIPVIAYDRLIMNSDAVSYYATFDNYMIGTKQGQYIVDSLDLKNAKGPFNLEIFTGDPGDNNASFFYNGAMDVLNPYIKEGKLVVKSKQVDFATVATANWDSATAQSRMENVLASYYADGTQLDAVLCSNDSTALGVTNAITASYQGKYPIITGQDCDVANVKNMKAGKQAMSIFKDTRKLADKVVEMVDAVMKGSKAPVNDEKSYDNGKGIIPSYLCEPIFADKNNYKELLIDSGYYKEEDLK